MLHRLIKYYCLLNCWCEKHSIDGFPCEYQPAFLVWQLATFAFPFPLGNIWTQFRNKHSSRKNRPLIFYTTHEWEDFGAWLVDAKTFLEWSDVNVPPKKRDKVGVMRFFSFSFLPYCASHSPTAWHWLLPPSSFFFPVYSKYKQTRLKRTASINNSKGIKANYWDERWNE